MLDGKLAALGDRSLRIRARDRPNALIGEDLGQQVLDVLVGSGANNRKDGFDLDADFAGGVD